MNCSEQVCLSDLCQTYLSARKFRLINIMGLKASNFRMNTVICQLCIHEFCNNWTRLKGTLDVIELELKEP